MTCAWMETSSADTGSSATMNRGSTASARAMPIRCRCPPENSCGKRRACSGARPTSDSSSAIRSRARGARVQAVRGQRLVQRIADAPARVQARVRILKDDLQAAAVGTHARARTAARDPTPSNRTSPAVGSISFSTQRPIVLLPEPDSPTRPSTSPCRDLEADVVDGAHRAVAVAEVLLEAAHREHRRGIGQGIAPMRCSSEQRERWPAGNFRQRRHRGRAFAACASAQRGANAQPGSGSSGLATWPGIAFRRRRSRIAASSSSARRGRHASKPARIRMARPLEQRVHVALLDDAPAVHDDDAVGDLGDDAQVVRDEQHPHADLAPQLVEQREDLRLDRDVERGRRLVGDQQRRIARERQRDHHPLPHAARQLMRILVEPLFRRRDLHELEHFQRALHRRGAIHAEVQRGGFGDLVADA